MLPSLSPFRRAVVLTAGLSLLSALPAGAQGSSTVQESAVLVGSTLGPQALDALVGVVGNYGMPQPKAWEFTLVDPAAPNGLRALRVSGRRAVPKAPEDGGYESTVPLGFFRWSDVKVDSVVAFLAADQEARGAMVGFDTVHFLLRAREGTTQPIWFLSLWDKQERTVGRLEISASTGKVERRVWLRYIDRSMAPVKVEDSNSPYASMRPQPPAPQSLPSLPPQGQGANPPPYLPPPPVPPAAPGGDIVPPPMPDVLPPAPEPTPGYIPLPN